MMNIVNDNPSTIAINQMLSSGYRVPLSDYNGIRNNEILFRKIALGIYEYRKPYTWKGEQKQSDLALFYLLKERPAKKNVCFSAIRDNEILFRTIDEYNIYRPVDAGHQYPEYNVIYDDSLATEDDYEETYDNNDDMNLSNYNAYLDRLEKEENDFYDEVASINRDHPYYLTGYLQPGDDLSCAREEAYLDDPLYWDY